MTSRARFPALRISEVRRQYREGATPADVVREIYRRIEERGEDAVWTWLPPFEATLAALPTDASLPLYGIPFAVKDNIDIGGWLTTAGCREFAYTPERDATVVQKLREAGAIVIGKTNLDQFATGLVGTRSPFGIPRNVFDERYISGGSSSGSAVAVAAGLVSFALGTDTAGSGRVPAAFNDIVGLKPTKGLLSTTGVVPACRSLDCVSIFAANCADAEEVLAVTQGYDVTDAFSRIPIKEDLERAERLRIGVPQPDQLEFFGDTEAAALFSKAVQRFEALGYAVVEIDFAPFRDAAKLLYAGPWVAERLAAIEPFFQNHAAAMHPVVREIIGGAAKYSAVDAFRASYELERLRQLALAEWGRMDMLLLPTTGTTYTVEELLADPVRLNSNLGYYTNFVNLLDLCGVAVPAGFRNSNSLPFGVTLMAPAFRDLAVCAVARKYLHEEPQKTGPSERITLAVVGAHLTGQPLNHQLTSRAARLIKTCRTAASYRLYALSNTTPAKPGLVRASDGNGAEIEVELWSLAAEAFGAFVAEVPPPLAIGTLELEDGSTCKGFVCEPRALDGAVDITCFGGWRTYLAQG